MDGKRYKKYRASVKEMLQQKVKEGKGVRRMREGRNAGNLAQVPVWRLRDCWRGANCLAFTSYLRSKGKRSWQNLCHSTGCSSQSHSRNHSPSTVNVQELAGRNDVNTFMHGKENKTPQCRT